MDFCQHIKVRSLRHLELTSFVNVVLLSVVFFMLLLSTAISSPLRVRLPKAVTSDMVNDTGLTVLVTGENILYVADNVVTLQELKDLIIRHRFNTVLIKADRRVSVGRLADLWDLLRNTGVERVNVATDQER